MQQLQPSPHVPLTPRQIDMLTDAALGMTRQQSARKRGLAESTVQQYRIYLCRRLSADNLVQAVALWLTMEEPPTAKKVYVRPKQRWGLRQRGTGKGSPWHRRAMVMPPSGITVVQATGQEGR